MPVRGCPIRAMERRGELGRLASRVRWREVHSMPGEHCCVAGRFGHTDIRGPER